MKKKQETQTQVANVAVPSETPRAMFLAANPKARALQEMQVAQIRKLVAEFRPQLRESIFGMVKSAEMGRQIGMAVLELEDSLPGKRLNEDFWRQLPELFTDSQGQKITRDMLEWFARIARNHPGPVTEPVDARRMLQPLLIASGEEAFQLEAERAPQVRHAEESPVVMLREQLNFKRLEGVWKELRGDSNYYPNGRLREDLRETLWVELEPTIRIVEEIKRELGY